MVMAFLCCWRVDVSNTLSCLLFLLSYSFVNNSTAQTKVFSHFLVTCQLEQFFPDASSFRPERWIQNRSNLKSNNMSSIHPFSLLPFGFGNRMCVGRRFSELQLYLSVAKVVLNFHLQPNLTDLEEKESSKNKMLERTHAFIVVPSHDVPVRLIPRIRD